MHRNRAPAGRGVRQHGRDGEGQPRRFESRREALPRRHRRVRQDARRVERLDRPGDRTDGQLRRELGSPRDAARPQARHERAGDRRRDPVPAADALTMIQDLIGSPEGRPETLIDSAALSDAVARRLRREIFSGVWPGGAPMKQLEIAERYGVSAVPVREAFARLAAEGLVVPQRHRGVIVAHLTPADFTDVSELRILLEPQALRRSAPHLSAAELGAAAAILVSAEARADAVERSEAHWAVHRALYARGDPPRPPRQNHKPFLQTNP